MILIDTMPLIDYSILEEGKKNEDGSQRGLRLQGVFQKSDTKNRNGRSYPKSLWERIINKDNKELKENIERGWIGELDHPVDGKTKLSRGSHLIKDLTLQKNGNVVGEIEILGTPNGKIAEEYLKSGVTLGISSRGEGNLNKDNTVNQEDYRLISFDLVAEESVSGAVLTPVRESLDKVNDELQSNVRFLRGFESNCETIENSVSTMDKKQLTETFKSLEENEEQLERIKKEDSSEAELAEELITESRKLKAVIVENLDKHLPETTAKKPTVPKASKVENKTDTTLIGGQKMSEEVLSAGDVNKRFDTLQESLDKMRLNNEQKEVELQEALETVECSVTKIEELNEELEESKAFGDKAVGVIAELIKKTGEKFEETIEKSQTDEDLITEQRNAAIILLEKALQCVPAMHEEIDSLTEQRDVAVMLIDSAIGQHLEDDIDHAIEESIEQNPNLEAARDMLSESTSADEVYEKASQLTKLSGSDSHKNNLFPQPGQILEEVSGKGKKKNVGATVNKNQNTVAELGNALSSRLRGNREVSQ